ncbi:unnamed protein product [Debaryomyces tyrocola]|nr:unnamed protein product [Debaryomyces tyrocola]
MTTEDTIPVWLDCDPGHDDAFAILLAAFHPKFKLIGISTVYGNASCSNTTHNTLGLLDVLGLKQDEVKVYSGEVKPMVKVPEYSPEIHGPTGLGGVGIPATPRIKESKDQTYSEAMRKAILEYQGRICFVCTGSLTNMSTLIKTYPELKSKIRFISIMGGGINIGNSTEYAEFNIICDPHAARHVMTDTDLSGKTILAPLNITHTAIATETVRNEILSGKDGTNSSPLRKLFHDTIMFFADAYRINQGFTEGPPVHDPLAVFLILALNNKLDNMEDDTNFVYLKRHVDVVEEGKHEGETQICRNELDKSEEEVNGIYIAMEVNIELFWTYVLQALEEADKHVSKPSIDI